MQLASPPSPVRRWTASCETPIIGSALRRKVSVRHFPSCWKVSILGTWKVSISCWCFNAQASELLLGPSCFCAFHRHRVLKLDEVHASVGVNFERLPACWTNSQGSTPGTGPSSTKENGLPLAKGAPHCRMALHARTLGPVLMRTTWIRYFISLSNISSSGGAYGFIRLCSL